MTPLCSLHHLSNQGLLDETRRLAGRERTATADLIAAIAEVDARRLYLGEGCSSMFVYCTRVLRLSEHAAYGRIEAARLARRVPAVLDRLTDRSLTLTAVCLLSPHLTMENHEAILDAARHRSKRDIEQLVAALRPRPDVPAVIRKLPAPKPTAALAPPLGATPVGPIARRSAWHWIVRANRRLPSLRPRFRPDRPSSSRSRPSGSRCSSPCRAPRTTSCVACRTCCGTPCRTATQR